MYRKTPSWSREQTWPPAPVSVSHTRRFLRETLDLWGLQTLGDPAAVVLSELATNAVIHAGTDFTVRLSTSGKQKLRLSVTDGSTHMPRRAKNRHATTGRGLQLIDGLSTEWGAMLHGVEGKTVWALLSSAHVLDNDIPEAVDSPEVLARRPVRVSMSTHPSSRRPDAAASGDAPSRSSPQTAGGERAAFSSRRTRPRSTRQGDAGSRAVPLHTLGG